MRKSVKKILAFSLAAAMVIQPLPADILNSSMVTVQAAPTTNAASVPAAQSRLDAAKSNTTWQVGANMPYFRYDTSPAAVPNSYTNNAANLAAMDASTVSYQDNYTGTKKESTNWEATNIASQASNQSYVELAQGQSITWTIKTGHGGDGVNIRYTLPDGSGTDSAGKPIGNESNLTISASNGASVLGYDNEDSTRRYNTYLSSSKIRITSDYAWQYFPSGNPSDSGSGKAGFAFDEAHFRLSQALVGGNTITITNSGSYTVGIDFIEVEYTEKINAPSGAVTVPAGTHTQSELEGYITQAEAGNRIVYFAPGVHYMDTNWVLAADSVKFTGAGVWYTKFQFTNSAAYGGGIVGEKGGWCQNVEFCHMYINSNLHSRFDQQANYKCFRDLFAKGTQIHDIWEEHFECGFWVGRYDSTSINPSSDLNIYNCRIRNNYADGVNFCQGTSNSNVHNCDIRNNGDDGLAMWNATDFQPDDEFNNIFCYNTIEFIWRAGGIAVYGGEGHKVYNNYIRDTFLSSGIHLNTEFNGHKFNNTTNIDFSNNVLVRTGTNKDSWGEGLAAIDIKGGVKNITFNNNEIYDAQANGIRTFNCDGTGIVFNNTLIYGVGLDKMNDSYSCSAHSETAVRQSGTGVTYNNLLVRNVAEKYVSQSNNTNWPYYCDSATNLPTISADNSAAGNTNYSFTIDSSGNYAYSGGTYTMNSNADSFPGYDYTEGKTLFADGTVTPETDPVITTAAPTEAPVTQPTTPAPETTKGTDPSGDDVVLSTANSTTSYDNKGLQATHSWTGSYTYQGLATFNGATDDYKYLVLKYTGDISSIRLESGGTFMWFSDNEQGAFVTVSGDVVPATGDGSAVIVDLAASGVSGSFFKNFHIHAGNGTTGSVAITTAFLTKTLPNTSGSDNTTTVAPATTATPVTTAPTTVAPTTTVAAATGQCDLVVTDIYTDKTYYVGEEAQFVVKVKNQGTAATPSDIKHGLLLYVNGTAVNWCDTHFDSMQPGEEVELVMNYGPNNKSTWTVTAGTYTVQAWIDDQSLITESNENNNRLEKSMTFTTKPVETTTVQVETPAEVTGLNVTSPSYNTISVIWSSNADKEAKGQLYNVYIDGVKKSSNVTAATYTFDSIAAGTHTVKVTAVLNGTETAGATATVTVQDEPVVSTNVSVEINGYQISTTVEGFRTVYSINDPNSEVVSAGMLYGIGDVAESSMVYGATGVYNFGATDAGKLDATFSSYADAQSYSMTMQFAKTASFYTTKMNVRAYAKLADGTYVYSDVASFTVYFIANYLYQNLLMNNLEGHDYLYENILKVVDSSYVEKDFAWNNSVVKPSDLKK